MKHCKCVFASIILASYSHFFTRRVITLKLIKLMIHSEAHHTNYCSKKRWRDVNKQKNTNIMLLPMLFTIKRSLSIWLKIVVYPVGLFKHYTYTTIGYIK